MNLELEDRISGAKRSKFKSEGERRIAYFLDDYSIEYLYEPAVLVNSAGEKHRIWYPDFHLPEFGAYIEYYGLAGEKNYDQGIKTKQSVYSKMGMEVISVYPWMFAENWQKYIMNELEQGIIQRYRNLTTKFYRARNQSTTNRYIPPSPWKYNRVVNKRY